MQEARIELLQRMPIFGGIRARSSSSCSPCVRSCRSYERVLFPRAHQGDSMFVLEMGKAAVLKSWRGQDYLLQTLKEGDCFGEMAEMDHCPRSASVRAVEDCLAIRISAANLYEVYAKDLKQFALIQMNMGREVCRRSGKRTIGCSEPGWGRPRRTSDKFSSPTKERRAPLRRKQNLSTCHVCMARSRTHKPLPQLVSRSRHPRLAVRGRE